MSRELSTLLRVHWRAPFPDSVVKGQKYGRVEPASIDAEIYGWAGRASAKSIGAEERGSLPSRG